MQSLSKEISDNKNEKKEKKEIDKSILYYFFSFPSLSFFELFYAPFFKKYFFALLFIACLAFCQTELSFFFPMIHVSSVVAS